MQDLKIFSALVIWVMTILSGIYPFFKRYQTSKSFRFPVGESLASGVFLGAGLIHMLGKSSHMFYQQNYSYPLAFLISGSTFLFLLWLEHIGREIKHKSSGTSESFVILAVIMLSIHSFLAGAALGLAQSLSISFAILFAILAHKWAASLALAIQINKSNLSLRSGIIMFLIFSSMVPLGVFFGDIVLYNISSHPYLEPLFLSLAAGTFLYLGSLHGLERSVMVQECCNLKMFSFVIAGFILMALVAVLN